MCVYIYIYIYIYIKIVLSSVFTTKPKKLARKELEKESKAEGLGHAACERAVVGCKIP